jgi:hypothetical protein
VSIHNREEVRMHEEAQGVEAGEKCRRWRRVWEEQAQGVGRASTGCGKCRYRCKAWEEHVKV